MIGSILITSLEHLDVLDLPVNEVVVSLVVRTTCSLSKAPLSGKLFVLLADELHATVTDDFLCSTNTEKQKLRAEITSLVEVEDYFLYLW